MLDKRQQLTMLASIKEFWSYNKNYIYVTPFICLIIFTLYMIKPGMYLNSKLFDPSQLESPYAVAHQMAHGYSNLRIFLTLILPIMIIAFSHGYLMKIKKQSRFLTTPITDVQRITTLWLFSIGLMTIGTLTFHLLDTVTVAIFKHYLFEEVQTLNESIGNLYVYYTDQSYFQTISLSHRITLGLGFLFVLPLYHLMYFLFKRRSLLFTTLLYTLLMIVFSYIRVKFLFDDSPRFDLPAKDWVLQITTFVGIFLYIVTLHFALKEREI